MRLYQVRHSVKSGKLHKLTATVVYLRGPEFLHRGDAHPDLNAVPLQTSLYHQHDLVQKHSLRNRVSLH